MAANLPAIPRPRGVLIPRFGPLAWQSRADHRGDSGIGKAVAIAYAREGAHVAISYLPDDREDAPQTVCSMEEAGRRALERLARRLADRLAEAFR